MSISDLFSQISDFWDEYGDTIKSGIKAVGMVKEAIDITSEIKSVVEGFKEKDTPFSERFLENYPKAMGLSVRLMLRSMTAFVPGSGIFSKQLGKMHEKTLRTTPKPLPVEEFLARYGKMVGEEEVVPPELSSKPTLQNPVAILRDPLASSETKPVVTFPTSEIKIIKQLPVPKSGIKIIE